MSAAKSHPIKHKSYHPHLTEDGTWPSQEWSTQ